MNNQKVEYYDETNTFPSVDNECNISPVDCDLFIKECKSEVSSKGNPMHILTLEVLSPETVTIKGETRQLSGTKITAWVTCVRNAMHFSNGLVAWQSACGYKKRLSATNAHEITDNETGEIVKNPFVGKVVCARVASEPYERKITVELTEEQRLKGVPEKQVLKDENGKPLLAYNLVVKKVIGPSNVAAPERAF